MDQGNIPPQGGPKKGLQPMAWVGIGCGAVLVIGVIVVSMLVGSCHRKFTKFAKEMNEAQKNPHKTAAEMTIKFNKDLEKVSENDSTGEFTFRNKTTGEETTMSYSDIAEGKITVKDAEGRVTQVSGKADMSSVPKWVPRYPGGEAEGGVLQQKQGSKVEGLVNITTADAPAKVVAFFKAAGEKAGMTAGSENTMNVGGQEIASVELSGDAKKLTVNAVKGAGEAKTMVNLVYSEGE